MLRHHDSGEPLNPKSPEPPPRGSLQAPTPPGVPGTRVQSPIGTPMPVKCPNCASALNTELPFCGKCGTRVTSVNAALACPNCGRANDTGNKFCPACGTTVGGAVAAPLGAAVSGVPRALDRSYLLALLDRTGKTTNSYPLLGAVTSIGRHGADINFPDDAYLSPVHAQFLIVDGNMSVRDLGSRNGTWVYLDQPHRLADGDLLLVGSQVLRYRRLGYPGPRPPEQDATRRLGSLTPNADIANLAQIRADGSARDIVHLSPGRSLKIGREQGDWQFPYDPSMSGLHANVRSEDADFVATDAGSRNGVAIAVRGERTIQDKTRLLIGDQMLRIELS
jgi:pSer/pThr/pTyr-binding forkhead associated (FHA) protein/RNA polymerase subunit RPABC4/transcription elongation factor Spt4